MRVGAVLAATLLCLATIGRADDGLRPAPPGATACSGCHGPGSGQTLAGLGAAGISDAMIAFRAGTREATVMNRIANGFDVAEIAAIAAWIAESD